MTKNYKEYSLEEKKEFIRTLLSKDKLTHYFSVTDGVRRDYHILPDGLIIINVGENRTKDKLASTLSIKSGIWLKENYCEITKQTFSLVKEGSYHKQYAIIEHQISYLGNKVKDVITIMSDEEDSSELVQPITMPIQTLENLYGFESKKDQTNYYQYLRKLKELEEPIMIYDQIKQKKYK